MVTVKITENRSPIKQHQDIYKVGTEFPVIETTLLTPVSLTRFIEASKEMFIIGKINNVITELRWYAGNVYGISGYTRYMIGQNIEKPAPEPEPKIDNIIKKFSIPIVIVIIILAIIFYLYIRKK